MDPAERPPRPRPPVLTRISAGGVAWRDFREPEIALIRVPPRDRWQLPKGLIEPGESAEAAAVREVREEAGIETELVGPLESIEYWFAGREDGRPVRFHKKVHFFLLRYLHGDVRYHDHEVLEARWVPIAEAERLLAFPGERRLVTLARELIEAERAASGS